MAKHRRGRPSTSTTSRAWSGSATAGSERAYLLLRWPTRGGARVAARGAGDAARSGPSPPPDTALQVAFTSQGLQALGVPAAIVDGFSPSSSPAWPARQPLAPAGRRWRERALGWRWGGSRTRAAPPGDALRAAGRARGVGKAVEGQALAAGVRGPSAVLPTFDMGEIEPFGFADGLSQPRLDWQQTLRLDGATDSTTATSWRSASSCSATATSTACTPSGRCSTRPRIPRPRGCRRPRTRRDRRDLGRNGTYLVFRQLHQDVRAFWRFVDRAGRRRSSGADGRWPRPWSAAPRPARR